MVLLRDIATPALTLRPDSMGLTAFEAFSADEHLNVIAVIDPADRPVGLLSRLDFLTRFGDRFGRALWERRPIAALMDPDPMILAAQQPLTAGAQRLSTARAFLHGFIVVDTQGRYVGVCDGQALLRANMVMQQRRADQLERFAAALNAIMQIPNEDLPPDLVHPRWRVLEIVAEALDVDRVSVWRLGPDQTVIERFGAFDRFEGRIATPFRIEASACPAYLKALAGSRVTAIDDLKTDPRAEELRCIRGHDARGALIDA